MNVGQAVRERIAELCEERNISLLINWLISAELRNRL